MSDRSNSGRRAFLAGLAAAGAGLAGCSSLNPNGDGGDGGATATSTATSTATPTATETPTDTDDESSQQKSPDDPGHFKPMNPAAAGFEDLSYWTAHAGVSLEADTNTYYQGTQSAKVTGRSGTIQREFPVPKNMEGLDVSAVMNIGGPIPTTFRIHLIDTAGNVTKLLQYYHGANPDGWIRINPSIDSDEADMTSIQRVVVTIDGAGENKKYWVDSIRFHEKTADRGQVMFTFDYITRSIYEVAFPMMKKRNIKGAVAVPTDNVGTADRLTWGELREMQEAGWEMMSMSNDWEPLYDQPKRIQRQRMERAIRFMKDNGLGEPAALAYPKGFFGQPTAELAADLHDIAFARYNNSEAGLSQSAIMGPTYVNRARPNSPDALSNQMDVASAYNGVFNVVHNRIGGDAQNSRSEFREMLNRVQNRRQKNEIEVVLPSDLILDS